MNSEMHRWLVEPTPDVAKSILPGSALALCDQFLDGFHAERRVHHQHVGKLRHHRDRRKRLLHVERQLLVEIGIDGMRGGRRHQQRVAVGIAVGDEGRADVGAGAGLVDDGERLLERGGILIRHHARQDVGVAAGRERHDDLRRARWIVALGDAGGRCRDGEDRGRHSDEDCAFHDLSPIWRWVIFKQELGHMAARVNAPPCRRPSGRARSAAARGPGARRWRRRRSRPCGR